jgi:AcrR family transcriptional regulator
MRRAADQEARTDGRVLRGARNHEAIAKATYALVRETHRPPTVEEIAERAGVGTRTVFRQFEDLDALYRTLNDRLREEILAMISLAPPTGALDVDLRALVSRRAKIFEHLLPFRRAGARVQHQSTFLQEQDALLEQLLRAGLLANVGTHVAHADALEAVDALLSFEAWDRLRERQRLSARRAERVLAEAALAIVRAGAGRRE